jgi:hypothetical protein
MLSALLENAAGPGRARLLAYLELQAEAARAATPSATPARQTALCRAAASGYGSDWVIATVIVSLPMVNRPVGVPVSARDFRRASVRPRHCP